MKKSITYESGPRTIGEAEQGEAMKGADRDLENFDAARRRRRRLDWWHKTGRAESEARRKQQEENND